MTTRHPKPKSGSKGYTRTFGPSTCPRWSITTSTLASMPATLPPMPSASASSADGGAAGKRGRGNSTAAGTAKAAPKRKHQRKEEDEEMEEAEKPAKVQVLLCKAMLSQAHSLSGRMLWVVRVVRRLHP